MNVYKAENPVIIMLAGLPCTGKSTIAEKLEEKLSYDLHSLLNVRRDFCHKIYSHKQNQVVRQELYKRTIESLQQGRGVILDNTFVSEKGRKQVYNTAKEYDVDVLIIECYCSEKEAKRRMKKRPKRKKGDLINEPRNPKAYDKLAKRWQDILPDIEELQELFLNYIKYDTENNLIEEVKVNKNIRPLVDAIKQDLLN